MDGGIERSTDTLVVVCEVWHNDDARRPTGIRGKRQPIQPTSQLESVEHLYVFGLEYPTIALARKINIHCHL